MTKRELTELIRSYIAGGKLDKAIELLLDNTRNEAKNDVIMFSARIHALNRDRRFGVITDETHRVQTARLASSILGVLDEIDDADIGTAEQSNSRGIDTEPRTMKRIKIFLASSAELKEDREQFELHLGRINKRLIDKFVFLELIVWEDFLDAMAKDGLQNEYNRAIKNCDIFVMLFFTKVGIYTKEEFQTAVGQFKATRKPFIFTYFKEANISTANITPDIITMIQFKETLKALGHYPTNYKNIEGLCLHFETQLNKLADGGFIRLENLN
ncbi:MAG: hypothetical protein RI894_147 [Bacteroidota bacterium]|jgi:hypothetical protein